MIIQDFRFDLYTRDGLYLRTLEDIEVGGQLTGNIYASIRWSGSVTYLGTHIKREEWFNYRIQPVLIESSNGGFPGEYKLGMFVAIPGKEKHSAEGVETPLDLYDRTFIAKNDAVENTYTVASGTSLTTAIRTLLTSTGETNVALPNGATILPSSMVWEAGTSKLKIINELLQASGYFSLWCDFDGAYRIEKYIPPASRPVAYSFVDRESAVHTQDWVRKQSAQVPNKIICVSQETSDNPAMTATVTNEDPANPYSFQSQGVWVTETHTGIEATSQAVLTAIAERYLSNALSSATRERSMVTTPIELNSLVTNTEEGREVVENIKISLKPTALMKITTREVA